MTSVGRSFCGVTVTVNVETVVCPPPESVRVMVVEPNAFGCGVIEIVRLAPLPPTTMLLLVTRA